MNENLNLQQNAEINYDNSSEEKTSPLSFYQKLVEWSKREHSRLLLSACAIFGFIFISYIFVFQILFTPICVNGASMQPTINVNAIGTRHDIHTDIVFYHKYDSYIYKDIVIIEGDYAKGADKIIKRIIATPGQTITFKKEKTTPSQFVGIDYFFETSVYVNGVKLQESYIKEIMSIKIFSDDYYTDTNQDIEYYEFYDQFMQKLDDTGTFEYTLESDEYFCMGDNRNNSTDSRFFGPVKANDILGKMVIHVPYGTSLFMVIWNKIFG